MDKPKQMIVMRRDLKMRKGKIAERVFCMWGGHGMRICRFRVRPA